MKTGCTHHSRKPVYKRGKNQYSQLLLSLPPPPNNLSPYELCIGDGNAPQICCNAIYYGQYTVNESLHGAVWRGNKSPLSGLEEMLLARCVIPSFLCVATFLGVSSRVIPSYGDLSECFKIDDSFTPFYVTFSCALSQVSDQARSVLPAATFLCASSWVTSLYLVVTCLDASRCVLPCYFDLLGPFKPSHSFVPS